MNCSFCGLLFSVKGKSQHEKYCNMNPFREIRISPFKGKCHTPAIKEKCKEAAILQHKNGKGSAPPNFTGKTHKIETKIKISNSMKGNTNGNHRGDRQSFYKGIRMDSTWEVKTAEYLDNNNIIWVYNQKGFILSDRRVYYPDFFIYEEENFTKLIEVKGYFRENNKLKFIQFKEEYPDIKIELWDKQVLKEKKII